MAKTYDTYKDSGIAWIGNIPSGWSTIKNKYLYSLLYSGGTPTASEGKFYAEEGCPFVAISDMSTTEYVTETKKHLTEDGIANKNLKILPSGTILYSIYATVGVVSELMIDATISQAMLAIELKSKINKSYYKYNLKAMKDYIFSQANGNTQFNLNAEKVSNFVFCFPPLSEQQAIATYLNKKCGEIDSLISLQEEMISELQAYKQSVITEAVTKGLDTNVTMKDSGVVWIGEMPAHWNLCKLKMAYTLLNGRAYSDVELLENGKYRILRVGNLFTSDKWYYSNLELEQYKYCEEGDLLYGWSASIGPYLWKQEKVIYHYHIWKVLFKPNDLIFSYYLLDAITQAKQKDMHGSAMQHLTKSNMDNSYICLPPLSEQQAIASYLDEKTSQIDSLIALKQEKITELKDYKKSIIYEYVTGKKKV